MEKSDEVEMTVAKSEGVVTVAVIVVTGVVIEVGNVEEKGLETVAVIEVVEILDQMIIGDQKNHGTTEANVMIIVKIGLKEVNVKNDNRHNLAPIEVYFKYLYIGSEKLMIFYNLLSAPRDDNEWTDVKRR